MQLKSVMRTSPWNVALKDGRVEPRGYELAFEEVEPVTRAFRVMCRELAYDVTEMAATTYFVAREHGKPFTALPVFLTRGLHHGAVLAHEPGNPKELEGRRVGVNRGYTVTTGVWARGILAPSTASTSTASRGYGRTTSTSPSTSRRRTSRTSRQARSSPGCPRSSAT